MKSVKLENGIKVKVFEKRELSEKLGLTEEKVKLVMKYQKEFPELLQEHDSEFIIDARKLWEKLGKPQGKFADWIKRKITKLYKENIDYISLRKIAKRETGATNSNEYMLTVEIAKHVSMSENTDIGREIRSYFIAIEQAVREMDNWLLIRFPEKQGYNELREALKNSYMIKHNGKEPEKFSYINEANMLNVALLGVNAKQIKQILEFDDNQTREHLTTEINKCLYELQIVDIGLIMGGMEFGQRKSIIETVCRNKYKHIELLVSELEQQSA